MPRNATTGLYETLSNSNYPALPGVTIGSSAHNAVIEDQQDAINVTADQLQGIAWADIASASTVNIGAATTSNLRVTGTTTITAFDTVRSGIRKTLRFAAALTLTNNGTSLILPGGANVTTAANDTAEFVSLGSGNWLCTSYTDAAGVPKFGAGWAVQLKNAYLGAVWIQQYLGAGESLSNATQFTAALNAMITALNAAGGGVGMIPQGSYQFNGTVTLKRGVVISGMGIGTTTLRRASNAQIIFNGTATTTRDVWLEDMQINEQVGATTPMVIADRCTYCGVRRILLSGVVVGGIDIGTSANPSSTTNFYVENSFGTLDGAGAFFLGMWGGGGLWLQNANCQAGAGSDQAYLELHNTALIDGIYFGGVFGGIGDADYLFKAIGSANVANVLFSPTLADRTVRGGIYINPTAGDFTNIQFVAGHFGGIGGSSVDLPVIFVNCAAGLTFSQFRICGAVGDGEVEAVVFDGDGTMEDFDIDLQVRDCARQAAGTYAAIHDRSTNGVRRLRTRGNISAVVSTYTYALQIDVVGSGTRLIDQIGLTVEPGCFTVSEVKFGDTVGSGALLGGAPVAFSPIADDAVTAIVTLAASKTCRFLFNSPSGHYGYAEIETTGTATIIRLADSEADVEVLAAAGVPTGTTGNDNKITIYVNTATNIVYINNRIGGSLTPVVTLDVLG